MRNDIEVYINDIKFIVPYDSTVSYLIMLYNSNPLNLTLTLKINTIYNKHGKSIPETIPLRGKCNFYTEKLQ